MKRRMVFILFMLGLLQAAFPQTALAVGEDQSYSYFYSDDGYPVLSPDPYEVRYQIDPADFGQGGLRTASGLFVRGDLLYICDTGNDRILVFRLGGTQAVPVSELKEGEGWNLKGPEDVFVTESGELFIADTGNRRVLHLDASGNYRGEITKPDHASYNASAPFEPSKLVSAGGGRLYVQAKGVNRGLMVFEADGTYAGYMGASDVRFSWEDYIWKRISTAAQRAQMATFVPTEYNNIALDPEGFIFVTTSTFSENDLVSGNAEPVRRLNLKGKNILIENRGYVIGAKEWEDEGPSRFVDVTVLDNDIYFLLDSTKERIFAYDKQGNGLYVFGGYGTRSGYFQTPSALEHWGTDLIVADSISGLVTVLKQTEYGALLNQAIESYDTGDYEASYDCWSEIRRRNGNYTMAYDGIGKIMLRRGDYEQALGYLEYAKDGYYYSKAWKLYRMEWIEKNLARIVILAAAAAAAVWIFRFIRKEKEALEQYETRGY